MKFIAHRGACLEETEDTLASLEKAAEYGAYAVECDPRYTKDGVAVLFHDNDLRRLADNESRVDEITYEEMKEILSSKGLALTTLDELIKNYKGKSAVLLDLSFRATDPEFFRKMSEAPFRIIVGVHAPDEAETASKYFAKENILAFMPHPEDIEAFSDAGAGIIRLWEHWLVNTPVSEARKKIPADTEIWIMTCDKSIHHPLYCMDGSEEQIEKIKEMGADGMLLNNIKLAHELRISKTE